MTKQKKNNERLRTIFIYNMYDYNNNFWILVDHGSLLNFAKCLYFTNLHTTRLNLLHNSLNEDQIQQYNCQLNHLCLPFLQVKVKLCTTYEWSSSPICNLQYISYLELEIGITIFDKWRQKSWKRDECNATSNWLIIWVKTKHHDPKLCKLVYHRMVL